MNTSAILGPVNTDVATRVGPTRYRKQVLKMGPLNYEGRTLNFDRAYLTDLAAAFNDRAYDQVPFLLVDGENKHVTDPERYRGQVQSMEVDDDGLYAIVELTANGQRLIADNPNLGVSARIVEDLARGDGRSWPRAVSHVAGTLDPRVTGLRPWQAVDLSTDGIDTTLDLTDATYADPKETTVAETLTADQLKEQLAALPETERAALLAEYAPPTETTTTATTTETAKPDDVTDDEWARVLAALEPETAEPVTTSLSTEDRAAIDLANSRADEAHAAAAQMQAELAQSKWREDKQGYLHAGVPKAILDLAEPVLSLPTAVVIDLSETEKLDTSDVVRKMVDACKGIVDLSVRGETPDDDDQDKGRAEAVSAYRDHFKI